MRCVNIALLLSIAHLTWKLKQMSQKSSYFHILHAFKHSKVSYNTFVFCLISVQDTSNHSDPNKGIHNKEHEESFKLLLKSKKKKIHETVQVTETPFSPLVFHAYQSSWALSKPEGIRPYNHTALSTNRAPQSRYSKKTCSPIVAALYWVIIQELISLMYLSSTKDATIFCCFGEVHRGLRKLLTPPFKIH